MKSTFDTGTQDRAAGENVPFLLLMFVLLCLWLPFHWLFHFSLSVFQRVSFSRRKSHQPSTPMDK